MPKVYHKLTWLILISIFFTLTPIGAVNAFSTTDLLSSIGSGESAGQAGVNSSEGISNILLSLLFGKLLGNMANTPGYTPNANSSNPAAITNSKELIGFYAEWWGADTASFTSLSQNLNSIQTLAPFWATLNEDGILTDRGGDDHKSVIDFAHKNRKSVLLLVNNAKDASNGVLPIHALLRSQDLRTKAIDSLEAYLKKYSLDGVNIDFEMVPPEDKVYLTAFMRELSARLKPQGYLISIDVFPKQDETNDVAAAYDYAELGKYADKIIIMTYDNHGVWSGPGPIADIRWVENCLQYSLQYIPKHKVYMGIAAYGYDWAGSKAESIEHKQLQSLLDQYNPAVRWDEPSKSPNFNYTDTQGQQHQVWFENSESLKYKLDLVNKYDIAGAAMWRLGGEDPAYWPVFKNNLSH